MEEIGAIKYGKLRFNYNLTNEVFGFISEKGISSDFFIISSQSFYQAILFKLGIGYEEKNDLEVIFYEINSSDYQIYSEIKKKYKKFENFPLGDYFVSFGVKIK